MLTEYDLNYQITRSGTDAITQAEVKNYVKQTADVAAENSLVDIIIDAVITEAQEITYKQMNTELGITCTIDIEEPDSDGAYLVDLPYDNSSITIDAITAIDADGDSVVIDTDDYELRGNSLRLKMSNLEGYRFSLTLTNTLAEAQLAKFKEALLAYAGYKYMNRQGASQNKAVELLGAFIDYKNWM